MEKNIQMKCANDMIHGKHSQLDTFYIAYPHY
jgi:hypothetical protein